MKTKQYNIKAFEIVIEDSKEFYQFIEKNFALLKRFLLVLKGNVTPPIQQYLKNAGLSFVIEHNLQQQPPTRSEPTQNFTKASGFRIIDTIIRSGQEIREKSDLLILQRVNNGATITTEGNCVILGPVDGEVHSNGEFMLIKPGKKAKVIFHGLDITKELDSDIFTIIKLEENEIVIEPYKKDIQWG